VLYPYVAWSSSPRCCFARSELATGSPLELPLFLLFAPIVRDGSQFNRPARWLFACACLTFLASLPFVFCNQERPIYGEPVRAFANHFARTFLPPILELMF